MQNGTVPIAIGNHVGSCDGCRKDREIVDHAPYCSAAEAPTVGITGDPCQCPDPEDSTAPTSGYCRLENLDIVDIDGNVLAGSGPHSGEHDGVPCIIIEGNPSVRSTDIDCVSVIEHKSQSLERTVVGDLERQRI